MEALPGEDGVRRRLRWLDALDRAVRDAEQLTMQLACHPSASREAVLLRTRLRAVRCEIDALRGLAPKRSYRPD